MKFILYGADLELGNIAQEDVDYICSFGKTNEHTIRKERKDFVFDDKAGKHVLVDLPDEVTFIEGDTVMMTEAKFQECLNNTKNKKIIKWLRESAKDLETYIMICYIKSDLTLNHEGIIIEQDQCTAHLLYDYHLDIIDKEKFNNRILNSDNFDTELDNVLLEYASKILESKIKELKYINFCIGKKYDGVKWG